jgi:probable rRNA maturation factor
MVEFYYENVDSLNLNPTRYNDWFSKIVQEEGKELDDIVVVFCDDDYLLEINQQHLHHDYFTDIITFDYTFENHISGDLFISTVRVQDNAKEHNVSFEQELNRVMIHGILHLCGYKDKTKEESLLIRQKEDTSLLLFPSL